MFHNCDDDDDDDGGGGGSGDDDVWAKTLLQITDFTL